MNADEFEFARWNKRVARTKTVTVLFQIFSYKELNFDTLSIVND